MIETNINQFQPDYALPPGETLLDVLEEIGLTQSQLADRTGRPRKTINEIINGKAEITPDTALQFERVLGVPARFWNNRERQYRETLARLNEQKRLRAEVDWLSKIPVRAMARFGWIARHQEPVEQLRAVLNFFGVASPELIDDYIRARCLDFRQSRKRAADPYARCAWIRKGEIDAQHIQTEPFNADEFRSCLNQIRRLTIEPVSIFAEKARQLCASAGVALVYVPELPNTQAWGVTQWLTPEKALIQLSLRYKRDDHFWFTFFHEACHILKHGKREVFIESGNGDDDREREANQFAADFLIPPAQMKRLLAHPRPFSKPAVEKFADEIGIASGIVVGRLQHDGVLPPHHFNGLRKELKFVFPPDTQPPT